MTDVLNYISGLLRVTPILVMPFSKYSILKDFINRQQHFNWTAVVMWEGKSEFGLNMEVADKGDDTPCFFKEKKKSHIIPASVLHLILTHHHRAKG